MPAKDIYHDNVKNALIKEGWKITHAPLTIQFSEKEKKQRMKINKVNLTFGEALSIQRTGWDTSQHDALIYALIDEVKNHPDYQLAKSGHYKNAVLLAQSFINDNIIQKLDDNYKCQIGRAHV